MSKLSSLMLILIFSLSACSGNVPAATVQVQDTVTPLPTGTFTPQPSNTPSLTPTITATATITPTATVTPENFVLADSGSDIADVRISYARDDTVNIDFKYRVDTNGKRQNEQIVIWLILPDVCTNNSDYPNVWNVRVEGESGQARLTYKQPYPGDCALPFFDMVIGFMLELPGYRTYREVYRERINQPLSLVWSAPAVTAQTLTVKNFSFERTGSWSGKFSFEYAFSPEIPVANERYRFTLSGMGGVFVCEFHAWGPVITGLEGTYTIFVSFNSNTRIDPSCLSNYSSLAYDNSILYLEEIRSSNPVIIYQHFIDLVITLKKQP